MRADADRRLADCHATPDDPSDPGHGHDAKLRETVHDRALTKRWPAVMTLQLHVLRPRPTTHPRRMRREAAAPRSRRRADPTLAVRTTEFAMLELMTRKVLPVASADAGALLELAEPQKDLMLRPQERKMLHCPPYSVDVWKARCKVLGEMGRDAETLPR